MVGINDITSILKKKLIIQMWTIYFVSSRFAHKVYIHIIRDFTCLNIDSLIMGGTK